MKPSQIKYLKLSDYEGKLPPHDIEMEQVVLGACMLENKVLLEVDRILIPDIFYEPKHIEICRAILALYSDRLPVDILTVCDKLRTDKLLTACGGSHYVATLTNRVGSSANTHYHTAILYQKYIQRKTIAVAHNLLSAGYDDAKDCFDAIDEGLAALNGVVNHISNSENDIIKFSERVKEEMNAYEVLAAGGTTGKKCGIAPIDKTFNGFQPGELTYLAGRPGMGKSILARGIGKGAAKLKQNVAFFTLEMSALQVMQCLIADECNIHLSKLKHGKLTDAELLQKTAVMAKLLDIGLFIDDKATNSVKQIWSKCNRIKSTVGLDMIIIDYLQLIPAPELPSHVNENTKLEYVSRNLKLMAKDLNVPVIALSQLNRDVDNRKPEPRPILSDLRGSGAIEQDADNVGFIYRPGYEDYNVQVNSTTGEPYIENYALLKIAKFRMGQPGEIDLLFNGANQRFTGINEFTSQIVDYSAPLTANQNFDEPF